MNKKEKAIGVTVRQAQRNRIFYMVIQPAQALLNLILWVFIWVDMPVNVGIYIIVILLLAIQVIVWKLDTSEFFQLWRAQESKSKDARVTNASINLNCARIAKYQRLTEEELNTIIEDSKEVLGIIGVES